MLSTTKNNLSKTSSQSKNSFLTSDSSELSSSLLSLRVKASKNECTEIQITIACDSTVLALKDSIITNLSLSLSDNYRSDGHRKRNENEKGRYIRLIYSGRLLAPDSANLSVFQMKNHSVVHAVIAAPGVRGGQQAELARSTPSGRLGFGVGRFGNNGLNRRNILRGTGVGSDGFILSRRNRFRTEQSHDDDNNDLNGNILSFGESGDENDTFDSDDHYEDLEPGVERLGFDRLRADGLSRSEISALRIYFSRNVDRFIQQRNQLNLGSQSNNTDSTASPSSMTINNNTVNNSNIGVGIIEGDEGYDSDEAALRQRLRMEEEWMTTQGPNSEFRLNLNASNPLINRRRNGAITGGSSFGNIDPMYSGPLGNDRDFYMGFALGFFVGFMMMLWVWMPTVKHRTKVGILTGICFHMGMSILNRDNGGIE